MKADPKSKLGRRNFLHALGTGVVLGSWRFRLLPQSSRTLRTTMRSANLGTRRTPPTCRAYYRVNRYPS